MKPHHPTQQKQIKAHRVETRKLPISKKNISQTEMASYIKYGSDPRHLIEVYKYEDETPSNLLVYLHGIWFFAVFFLLFSPFSSRRPVG
jgi:hypothetical protein